MAATGINGYADLRGKSLAVAGVTDPLNDVLKKMMAANGLSERDFDMLPGGQYE